MTTVEKQAPPAAPLASFAAEIYNPDDVGPRNSPLLEPMKINYQPSPSPPPSVPLPSESPDSGPDSPNRKGSGNLPRHRPSQGDAVLISFMDNGRHSDIARIAGESPLPFQELDEEPGKSLSVHVHLDNEDGIGSQHNHGKKSIVLDGWGEEKNAGRVTTAEAKDIENRRIVVSRQCEKDGLDLATLALKALKQTTQEPSGLLPTPQDPSSKRYPAKSAPPDDPAGEPMDDVKPALPSIVATTYIDGSRVESTIDTRDKTDMKASPLGELPPIRQQSPQSILSNGNSTGPITLPSISDQLGDINHLTDAAATPGDSAFSQSPPSRGPPRFAAVPGHGSPEKSPNDAFRRELPSPGRGHFFYGNSNPRRPSQTEGHQYSSAGDYSSSNTETPSTDQSGSTPVIGIDRMSIDGITNPQIGGFQCSYPGCTAQPFQTQYLLNSHANVHSSNRPHYCSVKGCPRSEGGKGFKRKNEMIRHGLVHDSPGYVCPFCPDREHKYPRPDNLQRHVRVHHVDKDKDDPQLREVLSLRPEGPSRGRRRRGGTLSA